MKLSKKVLLNLLSLILIVAPAFVPPLFANSPYFVEINLISTLLATLAIFLVILLAIRVNKTQQKMLGQDLLAVNLILNHPIILAIFILSIISIPLAFFIALPINAIILYIGQKFSENLLVAFVSVVSIFYILSVIAFSIYLLGYLAIGEVMQRKLRSKNRNIITDLVFDYWNALPFAMILAAIWIAAVLLSMRKQGGSVGETLGSTIRNLAFGTALEFTLYFTYVNLAIIAFEDKKATYSKDKAFEIFKQERRQIFGLWSKSGVIFALVWGAFFLAYMSTAVGAAFLTGGQSGKFDILFENYLIPIFGILLALTFMVKLFIEQVSVLIYYVKTRHPEYNISRLVDQSEAQPN